MKNLSNNFDEKIIFSELDAEIFYEAITNPKKPNAKLKKGMQAYMAKYNKSPL